MASVKVSERIEASADAVWDLFRDFGGIQRFSKEIQSCTVEGQGVGAVRTLTLGALSLKERLEAFDDPGRRLQYSIIAGPLPLADYLATIQVSEEGDAALNRSLSYARVKACKDYIVGKQIDTGRITVVGYGPDRPVAPNDSEAGREQNRRVEMRVLKL